MRRMRGSAPDNCPTPMLGKSDREVQASLRRDLGLDLLERLWERADLDEDQAASLAVEAQHAPRHERR